jgi:hypothetical protein
MASLNVREGTEIKQRSGIGFSKKQKLNEPRHCNPLEHSILNKIILLEKYNFYILFFLRLSHSESSWHSSHYTQFLVCYNVHIYGIRQRPNALAFYTHTHTHTHLPLTVT